MEIALYQNYIVGGIVTLGVLVLLLEAVSRFAFKKEESEAEIQLNKIQSKLKALDF